MKRKSSTKKILIDHYNETRGHIAELIRTSITAQYTIDIHIGVHDLEIPPQEILSDFAFPCFSLAKKLKKSPNIIAQELAEYIQQKNNPLIEGARATGPYLNIVLSTRNVLEKILSHTPIAHSSIPKKKRKGERVLIEYVSPNTNKPLHLGHVRNALLGDSIARILEYTGKDVVRMSLINDRGVHICKSMLAYAYDCAIQKKAGKRAPTPRSTQKKGDHFVGDYYVMFDMMVKKNPALLDEAQHYLKKWEAGDKSTRTLWKKMNTWVLRGMAETYKRLGIHFDKTYFESAISEKGKEIILQGLKKNIFKKDESGAVFAELSAYDLPNKILLRKDGTSLYITQDIYLAVTKAREYGSAPSLYVIGDEQHVYLQQLFMILKLLGYPWADNLVHLSYGLVRLPEGRMKSREGTVVDADDLLDEIEILIKEEIKKREKHISKKELLRKSRIIALAAIKFYMLEVNPKSEMVFNPKESISFQGKTGPYIQYTYARLRSILRKAHIKKTPLMPKRYDWKDEKKLILLLGQCNNAIVESAQHYSPSLLAHYLYSLAKTATELYHELPVLTAPVPQRQARLFLFHKTSHVLNIGLSLLGIDVLESM